jgi:hypothetical protein
MFQTEISTTKGTSKGFSLGFSIGTPFFTFTTPSYTRTKTNNTTIKKVGNECERCYNITLVNSLTDYEPAEITIDAYNKVIIPYSLKVQLSTLKDIDEDFDDFNKWVLNNKKRFIELKKCFIENNSRNPCKKNHVGFQLEVQFIKSKLSMNFYIIIEIIMLESTISLYRIVFQGKEIECPQK